MPSAKEICGLSFLESQSESKERYHKKTQIPENKLRKYQPQSNQIKWRMTFPWILCPTFLLICSVGTNNKFEWPRLHETPEVFPKTPFWVNKESIHSRNDPAQSPKVTCLPNAYYWCERELFCTPVLPLTFPLFCLNIEWGRAAMCG